MGCARQKTCFWASMDSEGPDQPCSLFVFVFRFYSPVNPMGSCQAQSVFVCVEVLRPSQPNGVMSSAVSLPNHTFTGQA